MTAPESLARILILEDDDIARKLLTLLLRKHGYDVLTMATGAEVLAYLASNQEPPHLLLLDFELPDMTAREVRAAQREHPIYADIPSVLMTAHIHGASLAQELAVTAYLPKPFVPANVIALVQQLCSSNIR